MPKKPSDDAPETFAPLDAKDLVPPGTPDSIIKEVQKGATPTAQPAPVISPNLPGKTANMPLSDATSPGDEGVSPTVTSTKSIKGDK